MKSLMLSILLSAVLIGDEFSLSEITNALANGDVEKLSRYFDQNVEITILDRGNNFPKQKALVVMKDFFSSHPPKSFSQMHHGKSRGQDSQYCIGNLTTSSAMTFRVYIFMKMEGSQSVIKELRFNKE